MIQPSDTKLGGIAEGIAEAQKLFEAGTKQGAQSPSEAAFKQELGPDGEQIPNPKKNEMHIPVQSDSSVYAEQQRASRHDAPEEKKLAPLTPDDPFKFNPPLTPQTSPDEKQSIRR